jgi:hypothetical protein
MEMISKADLENLRVRLLFDIEKLIDAKLSPPNEDFEWLRSSAVRKILDISPATLQNLRIAGSIRYKKIHGSYYYSKEDLKKLFSDEI